MSVLNVCLAYISDLSLNNVKLNVKLQNNITKVKLKPSFCTFKHIRIQNADNFKL